MSLQQRLSRERQKDFPVTVAFSWSEFLLFLEMLLCDSSFTCFSLQHRKPKILGWEVSLGSYMVWFPKLGRSPQATILAPTLLPLSKPKVVAINPTHSECVWWGALVPILPLPGALCVPSTLVTPESKDGSSQPPGLCTAVQSKKVSRSGPRSPCFGSSLLQSPISSWLFFFAGVLGR